MAYSLSFYGVSYFEYYKGIFLQKLDMELPQSTKHVFDHRLLEKLVMSVKKLLSLAPGGELWF